MSDVDSALGDLFAAAGVEGWLHARDLDTGAEVGHCPDDLIVLASVFKVPVLLELFEQAAAGVLDVTRPVTLPAEGRAPGPFGLSVMRDEMTMSLQDLAWLMMGISDNAATDVICAAVGLDRVATTIERLGLTKTVLIGDCRTLFATMAEDLGAANLEEAAGYDLTDLATVHRLRACNPETTSRSTAREVTQLFTAIWTDTAATPTACAEARRILGLQVWPHRLAAGFPEDGTRTSGKTGTLPRWRNEAGVVEYADGGRYAVAVFTRRDCGHEEPRR